MPLEMVALLRDPRTARPMKVQKQERQESMAEAVKRNPETSNAGSAPFGYSGLFPGGISVSHLLNVGASDYLDHGGVFEIPVDPEHEDRKFGMCGTLRSYLPEGELM
jgi:hypothetical protein